ncbi:hypothetical protein IM511_08325 [Erythrobacteraceae bacterium E2-1 Yellow Sea]|nr:hypothetical protein [Erythrobacteraceae bacterium E2-1 Yellow Sea]
MLRLSLALFFVVGTTLMGIGVITVLTMDLQARWQPIAIAAAIGFVIAIPVSMLVARRIVGITGMKS